MPESQNTVVSVYIPVYNRAHLVERSINSVINQTFKDWELIIIDDGSTDNTREAVEALTSELEQPVHYIYQENRGLFHARNVAAANARGKYVAPLDSDDAWVPTHLENFVQILENHPELDWVYGSLSRIDSETGEVVQPSSFRRNSSQKPFMELQCQQEGKLRIFEDPRLLACAVEHGLQCSQQTSLIRRSLFDDVSFIGSFRNCEDQQFPIRAIAKGKRLAYVDEVQLNYYIHDQNISCVSEHGSVKLSPQKLAKVTRVREQLIELFELLWPDVAHDKLARKALRRRLAKEYFWTLGYSTYWMNERCSKAISSLARGLAHEPLNWRYWKTFLAVLVKSPFVAIGLHKLATSSGNDQEIAGAGASC